jgi:hypothetical protein
LKKRRDNSKIEKRRDNYFFWKKKEIPHNFLEGILNLLLSEEPARIKFQDGPKPTYAREPRTRRSEIHEGLEQAL